jgi:glycosyltransferase involved in cell wall biosynthesis
MIDPFISVIIPAHNEASRLDRCIGSWIKYFWDETSFKYELIIVENGSTDNTAAIADGWAMESVGVRSLTIPMRGKGAAVRTGMLAAMGRYAYMADVDLATPPEELVRFLVAMPGHEIVIGSRPFMETSVLRKIVSAAFHSITRILVPYSDTQCGFKLFRTADAQQIFRLAHVDGCAFDVEALYIARSLGMRVAELPVPWTADKESRIRLVRDSLQMFRDVLMIKRRSTQFGVIPAHAG